MSRKVITTFLCLLLWSLSCSVAADLGSQVRALLGPPVQTEQLRALGPGVMPVMAQAYTTSDEEERTRIARTFYQLGWPSQEAYQALMQDIRTTNPKLRLQVQWALGRVSGEDAVVTTLLGIMRNDKSALFRDKAACALAYDQVHLSEEQKADLFSGLINGLSDPKLQVRKISIQALKIHTGQSKGFSPAGSETQRAKSVQEWRRWLADYRANL
jgi:HEAT repeat protein